MSESEGEGTGEGMGEGAGEGMGERWERVRVMAWAGVIVMQDYVSYAHAYTHITHQINPHTHVHTSTDGPQPCTLAHRRCAVEGCC